MKVLIVDDSIVFRSQISAAIAKIPELEVVGVAPNGRIAIQKLQQSDVDLVILDMEMPEMGGIETTKEIKRMKHKCKIVVFSSQTVSGAEKALEVLAAGADDVVAKPTSEYSDFTQVQDIVAKVLIPRLMQFLKISPQKSLPSKISESLPSPSTMNQSGHTKITKKKKNLKSFYPKAVVIASSTGGPNALEHVFKNLNCTPRIPILIVQHMPPVFTQILARRLGDISNLPVHEATHGQEVIAGNVYLAPGGFHMTVKRAAASLVIQLDEGPLRNSVRPAADNLFESAQAIFQEKLLGVVLTGMGDDGAKGAKLIHDNNGGIIIQEKESCVVFGMPGAVFLNDDYDDILNLDEIAEHLRSVIV